MGAIIPGSGKHTVFQASSPHEAWLKVWEASGINQPKGVEDCFGIDEAEVAHRVEGLPGAEECREYFFVEQKVVQP